MRADEHIARVERTVQQLLTEVEQLPQDVLYREPKQGEWPVMSTLAHLAELLPYWAHEAAALAASPGKNAVGRTHDDPGRLGAIQEHGHDSLGSIVPSVRSALEECTRTLRSIPEEGWNAVGQHVRGMPISANEIVQRFVVNHAEEHATQIHATLETLRPAKA
jgi:uncharacterized damage-inducible protein DinB